MKDLELLSFRLLIDHVVTLVKQNFRRLYSKVAAPLAVTGLGVGLLQVWWAGVTGGIEEGDANVSEFFGAFGSFLLAMVVVVVIQFVVYQSLMVAALGTVAGRETGLLDGLRTIARPRIFFQLVLVTLAIVFSFACCLPAIYVVPALTYVLPAMVEEDRRGLDAWKRSFDLVHFHPTGKWLHHPLLQTGMLLFVGFLISSAVTMVVQWPFLIVQQILVLREAASGVLTDPDTLMTTTAWLQVPAQLLSALATSVAWLYWTFGVALLYREIRRRREGWDLDAAIRQLEPVGEASA